MRMIAVEAAAAGKIMLNVPFDEDLSEPKSRTATALLLAEEL